MSDEPIEAFCARVSPALVGSLTLQCGDRAVAEDLAQEALAITWERWDEVSTMTNPGGWTYRVAFNLARSGHRRTLAEQRARGRLRHVEPIRHDEGDAIALRSALRTLTHRRAAPPSCCATTASSPWPRRPTRWTAPRGPCAPSPARGWNASGASSPSTTKWSTTVADLETLLRDLAGPVDPIDAEQIRRRVDRRRHERSHPATVGWLGAAAAILVALVTVAVMAAPHDTTLHVGDGSAATSTTVRPVPTASQLAELARRTPALVPPAGGFQRLRTVDTSTGYKHIGGEPGVPTTIEPMTTRAGPSTSGSRPMAAVGR